MCFHAEPLVVGKFLAAIPGQGSVELVGQLSCLPDQCVDHGLRFSVRDFGEHHITRVAFDQCDDVAVLRSTEQVTLPVAWHSPILDRRRPLADRDSVRDATTLICLRRCVPRAPDWPSGPQMLHQLFLQHAAGLHIKAAIDGLVRHAPRLSLWICPLQPARNLLGRPVEPQLSNNSLPQLAMHRQLARLWAPRLLPCQRVSRRSPVATHPAIATDLTTVDAARPNLLAIARTDWPSTMPRDISSRSA